MSVAGPIEDVYFNWLCAKVIDQHPHSSNYHDLMRILYSTEFLWSVHGDHNRAEDGIELRSEFLNELNISPDPFWYEGQCSVLEMLIAFSRRAEFQTDILYKKWFWTFLENLELNEYRHIQVPDLRVIEEKLNQFVFRTYRADGRGGILPMRSPERNQREVEIWQQFFAFIEENGIG